MTMKFVKAERKAAKLRLALCSPAGGGKTYSALLIAKGLGGSIAMIDTEHGSGSLYANNQGMPEYSVLELDPPFSPKRYIEAIKMAEEAGFTTIIIDSLSHAWSGEGGVLEMHDNATKASRSQNSFDSWRTVTPEHNRLVDAILTSKCHVIATMRTKAEYTQSTDERGKTIIKKVGTAPIQRDGVDYEFTVVLDLSTDHIATSSKDRTSLFDGQNFKPAEATGKALLEWLNSGKVEAIQQAEAIVAAKVQPTQSESDKQFEKLESANTRADIRVEGYNMEWLDEQLKALNWKVATFASWAKSKPEFKGVDTTGTLDQIVTRMSKEQREYLSKAIQEMVDLKK